MIRSIVTLILFALVFCQAKADDEEKLKSCTAWGDPHVSRFPLDDVETIAEVWCQESGWLQLLKNEYVNAKILVTGKPYIIPKFKIAFLDDDGGSSCVVSESQFSSAEGQCGDDVTITKNGDSLTIVYKKRDITITVQKYAFNHEGYTHGYSITIWQPPYLIPMSEGICKTSCDPASGKVLSREKREVTFDGESSNEKPVRKPDQDSSSQNLIKKSAEKICQIAISKLVPEFKITSLNQMNRETRNAYSACVTDVRLTGDLSFAKVSVANLAISLATKNLPIKTNLKPILDKVYARIKELNPRIDSALSRVLDTDTPSENKDDLSAVFIENKPVLISCRKTYSGVIKIVSAVYESLSTSCSMDMTARVKQICAKSPRSCQFNASNTDLRNNSCHGEEKKLKVVYQCIERK